jgi:membrane protease YdiL (CAAX protease family)
MFYPIQPLTALDWGSHALLWWPIFFPLVFIFIPRVLKASLGILIGSVLLGVLIGITEEILWRGLFLQVFPGSFWLGMLYPSILFGLWHIAPQSVLENRLPGGAFSFVGYAVVLGLSYALAAGRTGSIFWPAISHILHDTLGLGGFAYASWLGKHS